MPYLQRRSYFPGKRACHPESRRNVRIGLRNGYSGSKTYTEFNCVLDLRTTAECIFLKRTLALTGLQCECLIYEVYIVSTFSGKLQLQAQQRSKDEPEVFSIRNVAQVPDVNQAPRLMIQPLCWPCVETTRFPRFEFGVPVFVGSDGLRVLVGSSFRGVFG